MNDGQETRRPLTYHATSERLADRSFLRPFGQTEAKSYMRKSKNRFGKNSRKKKKIKKHRKDGFGKEEKMKCEPDVNE